MFKQLKENRREDPKAPKELQLQTVAISINKKANSLSTNVAIFLQRFTP